MYKYDVALSYESGLQEFVKEVSAILTAEGWNVYFALDCQREMLSQNLKSKLYQIYQNESLVKVLFVTDKYLQSQYTMLEKRRSLSSAHENERKLIVVNFIGERLPEDLKPFVYLDGENYPDDIAFWVGERIRELKATVLHHDDMGKTDNEKKTVSEATKINVMTNTGGIVFGDNANLRHVSFKGKGK